MAIRIGEVMILAFAMETEGFWVFRLNPGLIWVCQERRRGGISLLFRGSISSDINNIKTQCASILKTLIISLINLNSFV